MKFTKEEISLCKQVAKKHRKVIEYGIHLYDEFKDFGFVYVDTYFQRLNIAKTPNDYIQIWTVSDCLEFLRDRCKDHVLLIHEEGLEDDEEWYLWLDEYKETQQWDKGKTPLEACLKAVLAVLEEVGK
jgi:hypothetical protein